MEGPCIRTFPRIVLNQPVELRVAERAMPAPDVTGDIGVGGLFVPGDELPLGTSVRVRVSAARPFEAEGIVRYCTKDGVRGVGIEFTSVSADSRTSLDALIAELTIAGLPAA